MSKSVFSGDVLRLEIAGPKKDHLSVIDVPGIFKRTTAGVTTKSDMEMVERIVHGYMKNPRSVMLTVVGERRYHDPRDPGKGGRN